MGKGDRLGKKDSELLLRALLVCSRSIHDTLETRAVQGLVDALEPRPRGRKPPEVAIEELRKENARLTRDLGRSMALARAAQRSLGVQPPARKSKKKARRPSRGDRTVKALRRAGGSSVLRCR